MAQRRAERLDIGRKSRFTPLTRTAVHSGPPIRKQIAAKYHILRSLDTHDVEFCDSVRLSGWQLCRTGWAMDNQFTVSPASMRASDVENRAVYKFVERLEHQLSSYCY